MTYDELLAEIERFGPQAIELYDENIRLVATIGNSDHTFGRQLNVSVQRRMKNSTHESFWQDVVGSRQTVPRAEHDVTGQPYLALIRRAIMVHHSRYLPKR